MSSQSGRIRKGFRVLEYSFKRDYKPAEKRVPVYNFLKRTMYKEDEEKQKTKRVTINFIKKHFSALGYTKIKFLTLPGITWTFERMLRRELRMDSRIKAIVTGCEIDYKVFCLSAAKMPGGQSSKLNPYFSNNLGHYVVTNSKDQVYLLNADIFDVIHRKNDKGIKYDCIWFDTTNTVISISRKLNDFSHLLSENAVLIFTVLKGREHLKFETNRTDFLTNCIAGMGFTLSKQIEYFDSCPMLHLIYQRNQNLPLSK